MTTLADRKRALLQADREAALAEKRRQLRELGAHDLLRRVDEASTNWRKDPRYKPGADLSVGFVDMVGEELRAAMADLGASAARLESVRVVTTLDQAVSAQMTPFDDGSGLVIVADGIFGMCSSYCQYLALCADKRSHAASRPMAFWRVLRDLGKGELFGYEDVLTALLRYHTTHQRALAASTQLGVRLSPEGERYAWQLSHLAYRFVVGHEMAHHVLGHSSGPSAFAPGERLPACSADDRRERDADRLAFQATRCASERLSHGRWETLGMRERATMAALMAMMALHVAERTLFVHRGCTHPPAAVRTGWLLEQLKPGKQQSTRRLLRVPMKATEAATDLSEHARPFSWQALDPDLVFSPMPRSHLEAIGEFDAMQCETEAFHVSWLERHATADTAWLGEGARLAAADEPAPALRRWGVDAGTSRKLCDPQRALTFFTLKEYITRSFTERGIAEPWVAPHALAARC
ncbi:hypothetical protein [Streptomyces sp. AN091965]|uniref:hypothetical protein n=1 Tax=Streptomyces sp. AN091965 TaxID=2927803 RepID=UPI001F61F6FD|nr:hypothetical protein [Streptomyces sp. AN091965]MCI3927866.1 hypothetical protein [Streptomyces sp. AN091965]